MKYIVLILTAALLTLIMVTGYNAVQERVPHIFPHLSRIIGAADVGGSFTATTHEGKPITQTNMLGRPHAVFFGFTHCPDICPTTLAEASAWLDAMDEQGNDLAFYFATIDPGRDDAESLADYLSVFDQRITGITGTKEQMAEMARAWRVYYRRVELEDGYTMDHTTKLFLMNSDGSFYGTIDYGVDAQTAIAQLTQFVKSNR